MITYKQTLVGVVLSLGIASLASTAFAGAKRSSEVFIISHSDGSKTVVGSLGGARNSIDSRQSIACGTNSWGSVWCFATDRNGVNIACSAPAAEWEKFARAIASMNGDSSLQFTADSAGMCTSLWVWSQSSDAPKSH